MVFDFTQLAWFFLFIFQISISLYFYNLYRKDGDRRKLIFAIGFLAVSYSHLYEVITPSIFGQTPENFFTAVQYWSFYPLLFALAIAIHNNLFKSVKSNKLFTFYLFLVGITFPIITFDPNLTSEYIGMIGVGLGIYLVITSVLNVVRSKNISDFIFFLALISYLVGGLGLLGFLNIEIALFGFFTGNSYLFLVFFNPMEEKRFNKSYIKNYLNIKKELDETKAVLSEKEHTFQTLFNQLADPVMILDKKGKFLELTERVKEYTGFERKEILGKNFLSTKLLTPKSKAICIKNLMKRMAGVHVGPYEVEAMTKDGRIIPFEVNAQQITYQGKDADMVIFRDISERVRAQQKLRESEERYRNIFDQAGDGVFIHDRGGNIIDVNNQLCDMFGYRKEEFKQLNIMDIHPEDSRELGKNELNKLIESGIIKFEAHFKRKNNEVFFGDVSSSIISIGGKQYVQGILRDITDRKEAEWKLNEAHCKLKDMDINLEKKVSERTERIHHLLKQKDEFINQLGHDLKNPLGPLLNLLPLLLKDERDEKKKEMINVMIRNTGYMKNLVVKTIELAKLNSPNTVFQFKNLNLSEMIDRVIESNQLLFQNKQIEISNRVKDDLIIYGDHLRIEELFTNLINNAVKYSYAGGKIQINATCSDQLITISIRDEGVGMTQHQIDHVFDEFYKADGSRHDFDSSGLGMSICKRIVEKHKGQIWAESEGQDKGSTIYITIPQNKSYKRSEKTTYTTITKKIDNITY